MSAPTKINRIRYINSFAALTQHRVFNRATLSMFADLWRGNVSVYSVPSSLPHLLDAVNTDGVRSWHRLPVWSVNSPLGLGVRYIQSALCNIWQLVCARRDELVVFNFNNVFSVHAVDFLCRIFRRRVLVFCHNELEYLSNSGKHKSLQKKILAGLTRSYFSRTRRVAPGLHFAVLGDSILNNLKPLVSADLAARLCAIDHPVTPSAAPPRKPVSASSAVSIGTVGIVNYYKGASELVEIATATGMNPDIHFRIIGSVQGDIEPFRRAGIALPPTPSVPMDEEEFCNAVSEIDFILLTYPKDTYRLMASGAVLEALRYRKPVIAYRTDYFDYLFNKFGPFGYLADSRTEMKQFVSNAQALNRKFPFDEIARQLTAEALTPQLQRIISNI